MIRWLKRLLRRWLREDEPEPVLWCVCRNRGYTESRQFVASGAVGVMLSGCWLGVGAPSGESLVGVEQAVDQKQFWRLWQLLNTRDLRWADGSKFKPPV